MLNAYVLLNTQIDSKNQVLRALREIDGVEEVYSLWGVYDIIANIRAENMEELKFIITERIAKTGKINSKLTMIVTEQIKNIVQEEGLILPEPIELMQ